MFGVSGCGTEQQLITVTYPPRALHDRDVKCLLPAQEAPRKCALHYDLRRLLGLPLKVADAQAKEYGLKLRVVKEDGRSLNVQRSFEPERVDIEVTSGRVTAVDEVG